MAKTNASTPTNTNDNQGKSCEAIGARKEVYYPGFGSYYQL